MSGLAMEAAMIVKCDGCGQKNRIPAARVAQDATCGKCRAPIDPTARPQAVTADELDDLIARSALPVLVDFWAPWCGPCRMVAPELERLAERNRGRLLVVKLNTEEHQALARREGVRSIPMFGLYSGGRRLKTAVGYQPASQLERALGIS